MEEFNVLSLFDGMSCGQIALNRIGKTPDIYYASEIDKYAQIVSKANYPNTVYLGDVRLVDVSKLKPIKLLIGGSPCQSFSFAGKRKGMSTKDEIEILELDQYLELKEQGFEFEGQSYLFWEYIRVLTEIRKYNPGVLLLLENVMMGEKLQKVLTRAMGINPIEINSSLVSAQNRRRLYWTNIGAEADGFFGDLKCNIDQPKDRGILLRDILEADVDKKFFLSNQRIETIIKNERHVPFISEETQKHNCLLAGYAKIPTDGQYIVASRGRNPENPKSRVAGLETEQMLEPRLDGKTNCLTSVQKDNLVFNYRQDAPIDYNQDKYSTLRHNPGGKLRGVGLIENANIRRLTPIECERLQTVPDNYTNYVSDSQRYRMLGNGWTVSVICHIFSYIK